MDEARTQSQQGTPTRFAFGANWRDFAEIIDDRRIDEAERGLLRLVGHEALRNASLLDIGCGSGLHALAALRLGAKRVTAIDIDPTCTATAEQLLRRSGLAGHADIRTMSIFDAAPNVLGTYDIVYSWGALHHTGDLWRAMERAASLLNPGGLLVFALYRRTPLCPLWALEKRFYAGAKWPVQSIVRCAFLAAFAAGLLLRARSPRRYASDYVRCRGMSFWHDVHDWLGGYPYESAAPEEVEAFAARHGLQLVRQTLAARRLGLFGTGCSEYVYRRPACA
jgi:2-polyprenyl-6-hydroxyphenyl methylase/3-demethylubiquinone-9 3-methyltransferase